MRREDAEKEISTYIRQTVFERDNWVCQDCGKTIEDANMYCDYINPAILGPRLRNNVKNCRTVCEFCRKADHLLKCLPLVD